MSNEEWRPIVGFEGWYEVSSYGRIQRVCDGPTTHKGLVLKPSPFGPWGHLSVSLHNGKPRRGQLVHRLVAAAFFGPCPEGNCVHHKDGDPSNNGLENLVYMDKRLHVSDHMRGQRNHKARLTAAQVLRIRKLSRAGWRECALVRLLGVSHCTVNHIIHRRTWKHLTEEGTT